ncbi:MAG: DegT/DnrJ/EryC1/StrS family aminotransferase, partial [Acutalibacteraceae bacterium]
LPVQVLDHRDEHSKSSGHLYFVRFLGKDSDFRNNFFNKMKENGVACNVHFKPLPMMTAYKNHGFDIKDFPNAYDMHKNQLTLPMNSVMSMDDAEYVMKCFKEVYTSLTK